MSSSTSSSDPTAPGGSESVAKKHSKRLKYLRFNQQELPACKPILTPGLVITTFIVVGIVFIPIGLASLFASERVVELVNQYDMDCVPANFKDRELAYIQNPTSNKTCTRTFTVSKLMKSPVFIYYQLDNFYQNHRRYVKSQSDAQLRRKAAEGQTKTCEPEGVHANGAPIVPCGLIAWSLCNDTYGFSVKDKALEVSKKN